MKIKSVQAFQILDSRGHPTIQCQVELEDGSKGKASVPSGASKGKNEAYEMRDGNASNYFGKSVNQAVRNINKVISEALKDQEFATQSELDHQLIDLDGSENKGNIGANAILAVSLAFCRAMANANGKELYRYIKEDVIKNDENPNFFGVLPMVNIVNGGAHANNHLTIQEFMIIPTHPKSMSDAIRIVDECFHELQGVLKDNGEDIAKGDEGGYSLWSASEPEIVLEYIKTAVERAGYEFGQDVSIGLDVAASEIYEDGKYAIYPEGEKISPEKLIDFYNKLIREYPIVSIEDPFDQDDWETFENFTKQVSKDLQVVGDDLYCTNPKLFAKGIRERATTAILIKLNQIGTLTEALEVIRLAQNNHMNTIISHRSGETGDTFIADLAIAVSAKQVKFGGMSRYERIAKYNRLLEIEQMEELVMPEWEELKIWE